MRTRLAALVALFLLSACDSTLSLQELRTAPPAGDPYQQALAENYCSYAEEQAAQYDWDMSKYFADKGLMAAYGRDTQPEDPANWEVPRSKMVELATARNRLVQDVEQTKLTQPALAASAVVAYDRWVNAATQADVQATDGERDAFFNALSNLEEIQAAQPGTNAPVSEPGKQAASDAAPESTSTVLYFPFDSATLGSSAKAALTQLVHDIKAAGNVNVAINGHADRAGSEAYNLDLSQRRAIFVLKALQKAGVNPKILHYFAFGESDPAVPTADGVREPRNRRVEIYIE